MVLIRALSIGIVGCLLVPVNSMEAAGIRGHAVARESRHGGSSGRHFRGGHSHGQRSRSQPRSQHGSHRSRRSHYGGGSFGTHLALHTASYGVSYYAGPPYGYYGYHPFGDYYGYPAYYPAYGGYDPRDAETIVDTDIRPEKAEVYLDGEYVGKADDYDGYPAYLRVSPGSHTITFRAEGHRTVTHRFRARPGALIGFDQHLRVGSSEEEPIPERESNQDPDAAEAPQNDLALDPRDADAESAGTVILDIQPPDASVYIDGEFQGDAGTHGALRLLSGRHVVDIVRPGYRAIRRTLHIGTGDRVTYTFTMDRGASSR